MRRALLPLIAAAALTTPLAPLSLLCWLWLVMAEMPGATWVRRAVLGLLVAIATNAAALTALAALHLTCSPRTLLAVLLLFAGGWRALAAPQPRVAIASTDERWALAVATLVFAVLYSPLVGVSTGRMIALLSFGTDAGTHTQLVAAIFRQHGYIQLEHPSGLSNGVDHYPSAWHGNIWILGQLLHGDHPSTHALITLIAVSALVTYALTAFLLSAVVLSLIPEPARWHQRLAALAGMGLVLLAGVGALLMQLASYSQLLALAAVVASPLLLGSTEQRGRRLVVAAACCVCVMQSWYLLAPLIGFPVLMLLRELRPRPAILVCWLIPTAALCLFPIVTGPKATQLSAPGPILLPTLLGVLGLLLATALGCAFALRRRADQATAWTAATVMGLLLLVALILKQGFVPGTGVSYYAAKVLLATLLLGSVGACAYLGAALGANRGGVLPLLTALGLMLGPWTLRHETVPPTLNPGHEPVDARVMEAVYRAHPTGADPGVRTWVLDGCHRISDGISTKWLQDTSLTWTRQTTIDLFDYMVGRDGDVTMVERELNSPDIEVLEVYVRRTCEVSAVSRLQELPKVRVIRVP